MLPSRPPRRHRHPGRLPADDRAACAASCSSGTEQCQLQASHALQACRNARRTLSSAQQPSPQPVRNPQHGSAPPPHQYGHSLREQPPVCTGCAPASPQARIYAAQSDIHALLRHLGRPQVRAGSARLGRLWAVGRVLSLREEHGRRPFAVVATAGTECWKPEGKWCSEWLDAAVHSRFSLGDRVVGWAVTACVRRHLQGAVVSGHEQRPPLPVRVPRTFSTTGVWRPTRRRVFVAPGNPALWPVPMDTEAGADQRAPGLNRRST